MNRNYIMTGYLNFKKSNWLLTLALSVIFLFGCQKEEQQQVIIAKVGNSVLTENQLDSLLSFSENKNKYRDEVIRKWVDSELLFLEAEKEGYTKSKKYTALVNTSNKKLAGSLYLDNMINLNKQQPDENLLLNYYYENKHDFKIQSNAYVFNRAVFNDESKAILYRNTLIESDWDKALNVFAGNESLTSFETNKFQYTFEIDFEKILIILNNLEASEVSIIFETTPREYNIVQLITRYEKGTIPDFTYIKNYVGDQYISTLKAKEYDDLLQGLYSKYDVIINR